MPRDGRGRTAASAPVRMIAASMVAASTVPAAVLSDSVERIARHGIALMRARIMVSAKMVVASAIQGTPVKTAAVVFVQITALIAASAAILLAVVIPATQGSIAPSHHVQRIVQEMAIVVMAPVTAPLDGKARHVIKPHVVVIAMLTAFV